MGYPVDYLPVTNKGIMMSETLQSVIADDTCLISVMLANNEIGTIQDIRTLADIAHLHGALFHSDAVQAVGHIPVDVNTLGVDMLSASAHKFNGLKGIGFLYVRSGTVLIPYISGGAQEGGKRAGTENIAGVVGMAAALQKNLANIKKNMAHKAALSEHLLNLLQDRNIDFILNGDDINRLPGNVNISIRGADGEAILHRMDLIGICISTGSACDSVNTQVSHVIRSIGVPPEYAEGTIRITFGNDNSIEDTVKIADALQAICK
nr:cysteine desulfurase family protein [Pelotomaculum schinkii]